MQRWIKTRFSLFLEGIFCLFLFVTHGAIWHLSLISPKEHANRDGNHYH